MGKHLCMFSTGAILCPECFPVMLHGETAEKEGHLRSATPLARSEDKGTECKWHKQGLASDRGEASLLLGLLWFIASSKRLPSIPQLGALLGEKVFFKVPALWPCSLGSLGSLQAA